MNDDSQFANKIVTERIWRLDFPVSPANSKIVKERNSINLVTSKIVAEKNAQS